MNSCYRAFFLAVLVLLFLSPSFSQDSGSDEYTDGPGGSDGVPGVEYVVLPFHTIDLPRHVVLVADELFREFLGDLNLFTHITPKEIEPLLEESEFSLYECADEGTAVAIGTHVSGEKVIFNTLTRDGARYSLASRVIDTRTSRVLASAERAARSFEDLDVACLELLADLFLEAHPEYAGEIEKELDKQREKIDADETAESESGSAGAPDEGTETNAGSDNGSGTAAAAGKADPGKHSGEASAGQPEEHPDGAEEEDGLPFDMGGCLLTSFGMLSSVLGDVTNIMATEYLFRSQEYFELYMDADEYSYNSLYDKYDHAYGSYGVLSLASYIGWGAGGTMSLLSPVLYPNNQSAAGIAVYGSGLLVYLTGHVFDLMAANQEFKNREAFSVYQSAGTNTELLYDEYQSGYNAYLVYRILSYSLVTLGGIGASISYALPGEKYSLSAGVTGKVLGSLFFAFTTAGNYMSRFAMNYLVSSRGYLHDYLNSSGAGAAEAYGLYQDVHTKYTVYSWVSYGCWMAAGVSALAMCIIPPVISVAGTEKAGETGETGETKKAGTAEQGAEVKMGFVPNFDGFTIQCAVRY